MKTQSQIIKQINKQTKIFNKKNIYILKRVGKMA